LDGNGVSPLGTNSADAFGENVTCGLKMDPRKTIFVNSGVDFNGESTGTSLEVQIRL